MRTALQPAPLDIARSKASARHLCSAASFHKKRVKRCELHLSAQQQRSGPSNGEIPVASPFLPTRVRVQHDSYIRASRAAVWSLMQEVTPAQQWQQVAVVLATLESIYGVEYQGLAEQLLTAFQQANRTLTVGAAGTAPSRVASPTSRVESSSKDISSSSFDGEQLQYDHLGAPGLPLAGAAAVQSSSSNGTWRQNIGNSNGNSSTSNGVKNGVIGHAAVGHFADELQQQLHQQDAWKHDYSGEQQQQHADGRSKNDAAGSADLTHEQNPADKAKAVLHRDREASAVAAADAAFMQLLLLLAKRAGFVPLSHRDVALGVSLNTDFLWQLFVKVSDEQLDGQLVSHDILQAAGIGSTAMPLPKETTQLLVLRRGYSSEQQRGRWLIQKLDYLQLLLVKRALGAVSGLGSHILQQAKNITGQSRQQQSKRKVQQQQVVPAKNRSPALAKQQQVNSDSSSSKVGNEKRTKQQTRKIRTDSFGRPYPTDATDLEQYSSSSASSMVLGADVGAAVHRNTGERKDSSSSGGSSSLSDSTQATSCGNSENRGILGGDTTNTTVAEQQQVGKIQQQQEQQQQGKRQGLLGKLSARAESSFYNFLHTLSDWGFIPRMDVTPLEKFDEVYPLVEPSRFQPLYIQKATLPDILQPVVEPRIAWLAGTENLTSTKGQAAAGSGSGADSLDAGQEPAHSSPSTGTVLAGSGGDSTSASSTTLLQTLLQPVEIVEPTFRQLLVVHRKKPRQEKWRALWNKLTGQPAQAAVVRRSGIQLQVYRDIPLPCWQVVFPDKLLQFRPLDLLRLDLFALGGVGAAFAQAKYSSLILELLTLVSLSVWGTRLVLGYLRMGDRYKSIVAQLLAERTVAGGEGGLEYLATAAGLQQFKQAALAYMLLASADRPLQGEEVAVAAEKLLQQHLQLQVCFNAAEALAELHRFGLLVDKASSQGAVPQQQQQQQQRQQQKRDQQQESAALNKTISAVALADGGKAGVVARAPTAAAAAVVTAPEQKPESADIQQQQQQQPPVYSVLNSRDAQQVLQAYWAGLLRQRVKSILRDV